MDVINKKKDFTREEKILFFNDLRNGYSELVKRLKDYGENQETISVNKRSPHRRRDIGYNYADGESFLQSSEDERNDEVNYDNDVKPKSNPNFREHPDLPLGWKYAEIDATKSASHSMMKVYMDPEGGKHPGIASIAKYYIDKGQGMKPMSKYLQREGWFQTDLLPPGWYLRQKFTANNFWFLTNKGVKFNNTTKVIN